MKIGLYDVDSHNKPNLAQMKLSAWHKAKGDFVERYDPEEQIYKQYDRVYMSRVFDDTYTQDAEEPINTLEIVKGGTGYHDYTTVLPDEIEHCMPDYGLYGIKNKAFGFMSRGCPRGCPFCIVKDKEGLQSKKTADLKEFWEGQHYVEICDPNVLACPEWKDILTQLAESKCRVEFNQGLDARLLTKEKIEYLNAINLERVTFAWDLMSESDAVNRGLDLYVKYGAIKDFRRRQVYILCNYNTTMEENLYRVDALRADFDPFIMVYDKPSAPKEVKQLQRWVNNKFVFRSCTWEQYIDDRRKVKQGVLHTWHT